MQCAAILSVLLAMIASAMSFYVRPELFEAISPLELDFRPNSYFSRAEKREFNADDLSLRFGKRSVANFNPDDLTLRFGRK